MLKRLYQYLMELFGVQDQNTTTHSEKIGSDEDLGFEDASDIPAGATETVIWQKQATVKTETSPNFTLENSFPPTPSGGAVITENIITVTTPKFLWCLDNGHGRLQAGKRSPIWSDGTQLEEWKFNRDIVRRITHMLDELGIQYENIVPEEDVDSFLPERVERANQLESDLGLPKLYISIHGNAAQAPSAKGVESWYFLNSSSGIRLASIFQRHILDSLRSESNYDWLDRGIRTFSPASRNFYVLRETRMPAVLTENGFYSNEAECRMMLDASVQDRIAKGHVKAIQEIEANGYTEAELYPLNTEIRL